MENDVSRYQKRILEEFRFKFDGEELTSHVKKAFLDNPRHLFVQRFRQTGSSDWHVVNGNNLAEYLPVIYEDRWLILDGDSDKAVRSSISQPSLVLLMLQLLDVRKGQRVFEVGAASGWNASMLGSLVGDDGLVVSTEILPEMAARTKSRIRELGKLNIKIVGGDCDDGIMDGDRFDRAVFTVGAFDIPRSFYECIREGGILLMELKNVGGCDTLIKLRRDGHGFLLEDAIACGFVAIKGKYSRDEEDAFPTLDSDPTWNEVKGKLVAERPFSWSGRGKAGLEWRTNAVRGYLSVREPRFCAYRLKTGGDTKVNLVFGFKDAEKKGLALADGEVLRTYGDAAIEQEFLASLASWAMLGMPGLANLSLKVVLTSEFHANLADGADDQWPDSRGESTFIWSRPTVAF